MINNSFSEKVDLLLDFNQPNEITTQWTKESVYKSLHIDKRTHAEPKKHSELLAFLYQGAGVKLDGSNNKTRELF